MLQVREYKRLLLFLFIPLFISLLVLYFTTGFSISFFVALALGMVYIFIVMIFIYSRRKRIEALSEYLGKIMKGNSGDLDIRDNIEGELSVLKNEIYKVVLMLNENAKLLEKDKKYLANSISDISHQLKTPLTSMLVMLDLLENDALGQDKRKEFTNSVRFQLNRMEWLIISLLKIAKLDAGVIEFKSNEVPVKAILDRAFAHLYIPIELKQQTLEIECDEEIKIICDLNWTAEAITNIAKNCMEHTKEGGIITVNVKDNTLYTLIVIKDNGEGINPKDIPFLFNRFFKGQNSSSDSIGIGLHMTKIILNRQGATIDVRSELKVGTEFIIKIYHNTR